VVPFGKLFLIPVPVSQNLALNHIPQYNLHLISKLEYFVAENAKTARAHLKLLGYETIQKAKIEALNEHSAAADIALLINPLMNGYDVGLMSDAGCPGIADPGASVVKLAHQKGIQVIPLTGPSAIVLSIMASGFNGQNFSFVGYLPIERTDKIKRLKELETRAIRDKQAQFFIETPYRNDQIFDVLLSTLAPSTFLFVGRDLSGNNEMVLSLSIADWRKRNKPEMNKIPVVFGIYAY
jgi:16S rRNA (cytidine1402-2'-O)-methyltransferase